MHLKYFSMGEGENAFYGEQTEIHHNGLGIKVII